MFQGRRRMYYIIPLVIVMLPVVALGVASALAKRPATLGVVDGKLAACSDSPNCVSSQATDAVHRVEPIAFQCSTDEAIARLKAILGQMPRVKVIRETPDYLYAEATSLLFRFVDDVEFFVDPQAKVIHCRSASRVGRSDFGVNRKRVEEIRTAFAR